SEDKGDGLFYRFTPDNYPDTSSGLLEAAVVAADRRVTWRAVPDPSGLVRGPLRFQLPEATRFRRGEGMWFDAGIVTPVLRRCSR
ncbi:MAG: hypothetical protein H0U33_01955, partial [Solirubrobacterales bacterium]|nr:hypothetical protein [Solirubrobacterales bacterium]